MGMPYQSTGVKVFGVKNLELYCRTKFQQKFGAKLEITNYGQAHLLSQNVLNSAAIDVMKRKLVTLSVNFYNPASVRSSMAFYSVWLFLKTKI